MITFRQLVQFGLMMLVATVRAAAEPDGYQIVERAQDGATYHRVIQRTNDVVRGDYPDQSTLRFGPWHALS